MFEKLHPDYVRPGGRMKRIAAISAVVLLVLVAGAAAYLKFFFDPNAYRPRLAAAAAQYLGRAVAIDGNVSVALLPAPHARIEDIRVADAKGFGDQPLVQIEAAEIRARLWPLLLRRIEVTSIAIDGARVHL